MKGKLMAKHGTSEHNRSISSKNSVVAPILIILAIATALSLSACTTIKKDGFNVNEHVVMVDGDGELIDPRANFGKSDSGQHVLFLRYDKPKDPTGHFQELFTSIKNKKLKNNNHKTPCQPATDKRRILLFVHGGMNTASASIKRAAQYSNDILCDGTYPIFINWDSSLTSSYIDHLFFLRQGERVEDWCCKWMNQRIARPVGRLVGVGTAPFYATFDLLRGTVRMPIDMTFPRFLDRS